MTQTMRDKLQVLVDQCNQNGVPSLEWLFSELESILATEPPAVTVRAGWVCKDSAGVAWYAAKPIPNADGDDFMWELSAHGICQLVDETGECITDPWPDKPNGGPECLMEVR